MALEIGELVEQTRDDNLIENNHQKQQNINKRQCPSIVSLIFLIVGMFSQLSNGLLQHQRLLLQDQKEHNEDHNQHQQTETPA